MRILNSRTLKSYLCPIETPVFIGVLVTSVVAEGCLGSLQLMGVLSLLHKTKRGNQMLSFNFLVFDSSQKISKCLSKDKNIFFYSSSPWTRHDAV